MSVDELVGYIKTFATVDRLFTEVEDGDSSKGFTVKVLWPLRDFI
jgi:hypothetical protein